MQIISMMPAGASLIIHIDNDVDAEVDAACIFKVARFVGCNM